MWGRVSLLLHCSTGSCFDVVQARARTCGFLHNYWLGRLTYITLICFISAPGGLIIVKPFLTHIRQLWFDRTTGKYKCKFGF